MASAGFFPVYIYSTLDTGVSVYVSSDDTIVSLKRKLEQEHAALFPESGEIMVKAIKIEREGIWYRLQDSMPVSVLFGMVTGACFLQMEAVPAPQNGAKKEGEQRGAANVQDGDNEEAYEIQNDAPVNGVIEPHNQAGIDRTADQEKTNQGVEQRVNTMEGSKQRGEPSGTGKPVNDKIGKMDTKKDLALQELDRPAVVSSVNTRESRDKKRKERKEGPSSDMVSEVPPVRLSECHKGEGKVQGNNVASEKETASKGPKRDSSIAVGPGEASFVPPKGSDKKESSLNQRGGTICMAEPAKTCREASAKNNLVLQEVTEPTGVLSGVTQEKKRRKKTEDLSLEKPSDVQNFRERESQKGEVEVQKSNVASEKETASEHTKRDSSIAGNRGKTSSLAPNGNIWISLLNEMNSSNQTHLNGKGNSQTKEDAVHKTQPVAASFEEEKARNQDKLDPNLVEKPVSEGKKKNKRKQEAPKPEVKEDVPQAYASDKKESQTKKSRKGKSKKREGKGDDVIDTSLPSETTQNAHDNWETVQKTGDKSWDGYQNLNFTECIKPDGSARLDNLDAEKINTIDHHTPEGIDQPSDMQLPDTPILLSRQTKVTERNPNNTSSKGGTSFSADVTANDKTKKTPNDVPSNDKSRTRTILSDDVLPKGDDSMKDALADVAVTGEDDTEDEDVERYRVEFRNIPSKEEGEKMSTHGIEEKASAPQKQCRKSSGKGWRCKAEALPGKSLCAHHESLDVSKRNKRSTRLKRS